MGTWVSTIRLAGSGEAADEGNGDPPRPANGAGDSPYPGSISGLGLRQRLKEPLQPITRIPVPLLLAGMVLLGSALYFFHIGRNRYQAQASFIVRLPEAPSASPTSLLGNPLAGPTMLGSLEDGRFLAVYLTSPEVMKKVFLSMQPDQAWGRNGRDPFAAVHPNWHWA